MTATLELTERARDEAAVCAPVSVGRDPGGQGLPAQEPLRVNGTLLIWS